MSFGLAAREDSGTLRLTRGEKLSSIERIALLVGIGIFVAVDVVGIPVGQEVCACADAAPTIPMPTARTRYFFMTRAPE
jgi:hypothetical protein